MLKKFRRYVSDNRLFSQSDSILITNSGGLDSMALTKLFELEGYQFGLAHCNFRLRGKESDADQEFVKALANRLQVPFFSESFDTALYAEQLKISIQEAARELRYKWFEQIVVENGFDFYATAHHFDDQTETFFINLLRGTGISGLRGIKPQNDKRVRPLLFATKQEIEDFAEKHRIEYREDTSNRSDAYLRNRIRHFIMPAIEKSRPDFRTGFAQTMENLKEVEIFLADQIESITAQFFITEDNHHRIDRHKLQKIKSVKFVLYEILRPFGFNADTIANLAEALKGIPGKTFFSSSHKIYLDRDAIFIYSLKDNATAKSDEMFLINEQTDVLKRPVKLIIEKILKTDDYTIDPTTTTAQFDLDRLKFPLVIRRPKMGEGFYPIGMKGKKKLFDFFTDEKFTVLQKQNTWLLISDNNIAWIIGHRLDDRFKITTSTKMILKITISDQI
jgi:tRNA(Ile)-lysidine synthase